jgi:hypothetical protein
MYRYEVKYWDDIEGFVTSKGFVRGNSYTDAMEQLRVWFNVPNAGNDSISSVQIYALEDVLDDEDIKEVIAD